MGRSPPPVRVWRAAAAASGLLALAGCSLLADTIEIELLLPPLPSQWKLLTTPTAGPTFRILIAGREGTVELVTAPGESAPRARLPKEGNLPVIAYPILAGTDRLLKPAGALFPLDLDDAGRLPLCWSNGFLAETLSAFSGAGELRASINARRLEQEIRVRANGDPWTLDRELLLETLPYGSLSADRIRQRPLHTLTLHAAGSWIAVDPFRVPLESGPDGLLVLERIAEGSSSYLRADETASDPAVDMLELFVDRKGWICRSAATGTSESGRW